MVRMHRHGEIVRLTFVIYFLDSCYSTPYLYPYLYKVLATGISNTSLLSIFRLDFLYCEYY